MDKHSILKILTRNYSAMVAILLGMTFGLGYVLGDIFSHDPPSNQVASATTLAQLDAQFEAAQKKYAHHNLDYYDRLHKKPPKVVARVVAEPEEKENPEIELGQAPSSGEPGKAERIAVFEGKSEPIQQPKSNDSIAEALSNVLGDSAPSPVKVEKEKLLPTSTGSPFAIQVASFLEQSQARTLSEKLAGAGHSAKVVRGELDDDRTVFRVRIDGFEDKNSAVDYLVKNQGVTPGFDFGFIIAQ